MSDYLPEGRVMAHGNLSDGWQIWGGIWHAYPVFTHDHQI